MDNLKPLLDDLILFHNVNVQYDKGGYTYSIEDKDIDCSMLVCDTTGIELLTLLSCYQHCQHQIRLI
jgi:hypothetical protein